MTEKRFDYEYVDDKFYNKGFFLDNGKEMFKDEVLNTLNELHEENQHLRKILNIGKTNAKDIVDVLNVQQNRIIELDKENKELKQFKQQVFDLIDEHIKHYRKYSILTVRMPMDCKYRKGCLENHSVNVYNKAKENAYKELKKEIGE